MTGYEESENIVVGVSTDLKKPLDEYESLMLALPADGHGGRAGGRQRREGGRQPLRQVGRGVLRQGQ